MSAIPLSCSTTLHDWDCISLLQCSAGCYNTGVAECRADCSNFVFYILFLDYVSRFVLYLPRVVVYFLIFTVYVFISGAG